MEAEQDVKTEFLCPLSYEIMEDPVIDENGHTYDRKSIEEHFKKNGRRSPFTNRTIKMLIPNRSLRTLIEESNIKTVSAEQKSALKDKTAYEQELEVLKAKVDELEEKNQELQEKEVVYRQTIESQNRKLDKYIRPHRSNVVFPINDIYGRSHHPSPFYGTNYVYAFGVNAYNSTNLHNDHDYRNDYFPRYI